MSKVIQYPNGQRGVASDEVADILAKRPGHKIIEGAKPEPPKPFEKPDAEGDKKK
jgi:hypothetical protein